MDYYQPFTTYSTIELGKAKSTIREYLFDVKRFRHWLDTEALENGVPLTWSAVTPRHIRAYMAWLSEEHNRLHPNGTVFRSKGVSPRTIQRATASLRVWFDYLVDIEELMLDNPARALKTPRLPKRYPSALTTAEVDKLIKAAGAASRHSERVRNQTMIAFLFHTGLRISEFCNITVPDIAYQDGLPRSIRIIGKGNKERRVVLSAGAQQALRQWLWKRREIVVDASSKDSAYVWLIPAGNRKGKPITPAGVRFIMKRLGESAGLKDVHPHLLRHSFATEAVRRGAKMHALQAFLGHSSIATTGIYLHADEAALEEVASVMSATTEPMPDEIGLPYDETDRPYYI